MSRIDRSAFLHELYRRAASVKRAADAIRVTERTFGKWLKLPEDRLQALSIDWSDWLVAATEFDIAMELFEPPKTLWDEHRSFSENLALAPPQFPQTGVLRDLRDPFLGRELLSCFGAASGVTTIDGARVEFLFHAGCATVVFKTIRARGFPPVPGPNLLYCAQDTPELDPDIEPPAILAGDSEEGFSAAHGTVNSFRLPSGEPEQLQVQIRRANSAAGPNQLFILSVIGDSDRNDDAEIIENFVATVELGLSCGVEAFELAFGCVTDPAAYSIHAKAGLPRRIAEAVRAAVGDCSVLVKLPYLPASNLEALVVELAPYVDGFSAINTIAVTAVRHAGPRGCVAAFGGAVAGLGGHPILPYGLRCARELVAIREHHKLTKKAIIGVGGVCSPRDVLLYRDEGVDHVQAASIFHADPLFALKVHDTLAAQKHREGRTTDDDLEIVWQNLGKAMRFVTNDGYDSRLVTKVASQIYTEVQDNYARLGPSPRRARIRSVAELMRELRYRLASSRFAP
jgi:dihydroorotate dehydrogenase